MNNFVIEEGANNTVIIKTDKNEFQFAKNALFVISDDTDTLMLRAIGTRKNTIELLWEWVPGATSKENAIELINELIFD